MDEGWADWVEGTRVDALCLSGADCTGEMAVDREKVQDPRQDCGCELELLALTPFC